MRKISFGALLGLAALSGAGAQAQTVTRAPGWSPRRMRRSSAASVFRPRSAMRSKRRWSTRRFLPHRLGNSSRNFGRTLQPNSNAGTNHAWGSHHFVIGTGAVNGGSLQGGRIWGQFPSLVLGGDDDANSRGTLLPTTSVDQYAATMAEWFGVSPDDALTIFPYVKNFLPVTNLGFLG